MKESKQLLQYMGKSEINNLSPSKKNKLNMNFTFTKEKGSQRQRNYEDEFYYELNRKLDENTIDIKKIKENMNTFQNKKEPLSFKEYSLNMSPQILLERSYAINKKDKKNDNSRNEDFYKYLASLKQYKAEAIFKTLLFNKRKRSAILIQKAFRGFVVRKAYNEMKTKNILERCKNIIFMKKREFIKKNALQIIMKHMKTFVQKMKLRKKLLYKKFLNHCAKLIQRFFKYRVRLFYRSKKSKFSEKALAEKNLFNPKKAQTPDFSIIKNESFISSMKNTLFLKTGLENTIEDSFKIGANLPNQLNSIENEGQHPSNNAKIEEDPNIIRTNEKNEVKTANKWDETPIKGVKNTANMQDELDGEKEPNKWELRENMPVGGGNKNEPNKWELRENMPIGGGSKKPIDFFGGEEKLDSYVPSNKKPIQKREFLKRKNPGSTAKKVVKTPEKNEENEDEKTNEEEIKKPRSHFKNFSKNLSEIKTENLNNTSMEEKEVTNTLSALTYESPIKTNFKKKSQLFSPALHSGLSTPLKSESPVKQPFLKRKKNTPKTTKKDDKKEKSLSTKRNLMDEEEPKEKKEFLKKKTKAVISQKLNWNNIKSRTDCGLNKKKSPPSSAHKNDNDSIEFDQQHFAPPKIIINNKSVPLLNLQKKKSLFNKTPNQGEIREKIYRKMPDSSDFREKMLMRNPTENDYTTSNLTLPEMIPTVQLNPVLPLQLKNQQFSDGLNSVEQNQLNQLIQMSSLEFRNTNTTNRMSENRKDVSTLSRIYKGSESSINTSIKYEKPLAVEELERAYRTNYFGKLTSKKLKNKKKLLLI